MKPMIQVISHDKIILTQIGTFFNDATAAQVKNWDNGRQFVFRVVGVSDGLADTIPVGGSFDTKNLLPRRDRAEHMSTLEYTVDVVEDPEEIKKIMENLPPEGGGIRFTPGKEKSGTKGEGHEGV